MNKFMLAVMLFCIMVGTNGMVSAKIKNITIKSEEVAVNSYRYSFPSNMLHRYINKIEFYQDYNLFSGKCSAYVDIELNENQSGTVLVALNKIELIIKDSSQSNKCVIPIQINGVLFAKSNEFKVLFEYPIDRTLFNTAKIRLCFSVKNIGGQEDLDYTINFNDLKKLSR